MWFRLSMLAAVLAMGCVAESASTAWEMQRSVSGDTTTVHTVGGQVWSDVSLREGLVIGALDGPLPLVFGEVSRLADDHHGGIYVFDRQVPEVRHFDQAGEFVGTVGRAGEGPGEYEVFSLGMVVDADDVLYVHAWGNRRIVRFARDGRALEPWVFDSPFMTTRPGTWLYSDAPGRVLVTTRIDQQPALLVLQEGQVTDTLVVPQLPGVPQKRGGPYDIERYWSWHPDGYFVVGVSDEYSLEAHRTGGVNRIRRDAEELPVHSEEADEIRRQFEWMARQPQYQPPEGEWVPSTMPPFRGIAVGGDGLIWVRRNTHPVQVPVEDMPDGQPVVGWIQPFLYDVFEADGTFLGEIRFPDRFEPRLFGAGYIWGVRRGELDEHYVVRLSIEVGGGGA
jgi:6-bladed beta-propeller protein